MLFVGRWLPWTLFHSSSIYIASDLYDPFLVFYFSFLQIPCMVRRLHLLVRVSDFLCQGILFLASGWMLYTRAWFVFSSHKLIALKLIASLGCKFESPLSLFRFGEAGDAWDQTCTVQRVQSTAPRVRHEGDLAFVTAPTPAWQDDSTPFIDIDNSHVNTTRCWRSTECFKCSAAFGGERWQEHSCCSE